MSPKAAFGRNRSYDRNTTDGKAIRGNYLRAARRSHTHRLQTNSLTDFSFSCPTWLVSVGQMILHSD